MTGWFSWLQATAVRQRWAAKCRSTSALINCSSVGEVKLSPSKRWTLASVKRRLTEEPGRFKFSAFDCILQKLSPLHTPKKLSSGSCLVSTWNLAGCDCAEKGDTFQTYHGVRGLEEPIGGQLTAQSLLPPTTENKKAHSRGEKRLIQKEKWEWRIPSTN